MASYPRQIWFQRREALEVVGGSEEVDIGQGGPHTARLRAVVPPADQRIEPDDPAATAAKAPHLLGKLLGLAGIVAIGDDHHGGARIDDAPRVPAIEGGEAFADAGA